MQIKQAAGALGAFISDLDLTRVVEADADLNTLRQAVHDYQVVFLPDQQVSPQVFQTCARGFGEVLGHGAYGTVEGAPDVQVLESTPEAPSKIEVWHSDMTFSTTPPMYTLLHSQVIPAYGGDTLWASAAAAYEQLSEPMRAFCDELVAVHDFRHGFAESLAEPGGAERLADAIAANPPVEHPLVRTHPHTGRKCLYVNALFTTHIKDMSPLESRQILDFLYRHIVTAEFTVRLDWQEQMVAIWDNCSTQHKPVNDFFPQHRKLHRVTIKGQRPA